MAAKPHRHRYPETARETACRILVDWERGKGPLERIRDTALARTLPSSLDRALIMELTQGVLRHRLILDHWIQGMLDRPGRALPVAVQTALRIGIYQIMFLQKIPIHAVVAETVNLVKTPRYGGFASLVNAVLRKAAKGPPPLPREGKDPVAHLALLTSAPRWLVEKLIESRGAGEAKAVLQAINRPAPLTLRVNTLRADRDFLMEELRKQGLAAIPVALSPWSVILESGKAPFEITSFQRGLCTVQDEGAQLIAPLLEAKPGQTIIDACAAPGGKAGHLAQLMEDEGTILAVDRSAPRMGMMIKALKRLGVRSVRPLVADVRNLSNLQRTPVSGILLDSPCSGTGVLRRHPEGKWKKDPATIADLARLQGQFVETASEALITGGHLLYTTCSFLREENEDVIDRVLSRGELSLVDLRKGRDLPPGLFTERGELRTWPHLHNCDGFYAALLKKEK